MANPDSFYTYIYYDPSRNNEPIYVGKGYDKRVWEHLSIKKKMHPFIQRLQFMQRNGIKPIIGIYSDLTEDEAFSYEMWFIYKFGRKDLGKGTLLNLSDGSEGASGAIRSESFKENLSKMYKDVPKSEDHKKSMSKAQKGLKRSQKVKDAMSAYRKGKPSKKKGTSQPCKKHDKILTPDGIFNNIHEVTKFYEISSGTAYARCSRGTSGWKIIKKEK